MQMKIQNGKWKIRKTKNNKTHIGMKKKKKEKRKEMSHGKLSGVVVKETKREGGVRQSLTECNGAQRRWRGGVRWQSSMAVVV